MTTPKTVFDKIRGVLSNAEKVADFEVFSSGGKREKGNRIYLAVHTNLRDFFVKYDSNAKFDVFKNEYEALQCIGSTSFSIPKPIALVDKGILMSKIEGTSLEGIVKQGGLIKTMKLLNDAIVRIAGFHKGHISSLNKHEKMEIYQQITGDEIYSGIQKEFDQSSFGFTHGDLDPFNMLYDSETSELGLIDWENFSARGSQELDVLHFVIMLAVIENPDASHEELYGILFKEQEKNFYRDLLLRYCKERKIFLTSVLALIPVYCDAQNHRLVKAQRSTGAFLYTDFKKLYYEIQ